MNIYPNSYTVEFCYWLINVSWQELTPTRLNLITAVYNAGVSGTSVTEQQWINFVQVTSWREPYFLAWRNGNTPISSVPTGVCDFWLSSLYLVKNSTNFSGQTRFNNQIQRISDILGGSVYGNNSNASREPYPIIDNSQKLAKQLFAFNTSANQFFNLNNAGSLVQNSTGYSLFVIANTANVTSSLVAVYFSSGANVAKARIGIQVNGSNNWQGLATRLDADAQASLTGTSASNTLQIICFTIDYSTGKGVIYVNGTAVNTNNSLTTAGNTSNVASSQVSIGSLNSAQIWNGCISDVLAFQTALSSTDVLTITNWLNDLRGIF